MCGHKGHGTELGECTADRMAVVCIVVGYTVAVRWDFAAAVVVAAAVEQSAVPAAAAVVPVAAIVGVSVVLAAEH